VPGATVAAGAGKGDHVAGSSPFELLASADVLVDDHDVVLRRWQEAAGLPEQNPRWTRTPPGTGTRWTYARLGRDRHRSPTELEVISPWEVPPPGPRPVGYPYIGEIADAQGDRPSKLHSTVVSTNRFDEVVARLRDEGAPHRIDEPDEHLPFPRLWVGFHPGRPDQYDPAADGGIRLEVLPHEVLGYPDPAARREEPEPAPGALRRIAARLILVDDLDDVLGRLQRNFAWTPDAVVSPADGSRRAQLGFAHPASAVLELVQPPPGEASRAGRFASRWAAGAYAIRFSVRDLDAAAAELEARGTPCRRDEAHDGSGRPALVIPIEVGLGCEVELVEEPTAR